MQHTIPFGRREFLAGCGTALAGAALARGEGRAIPHKRGVRFGVRAPLPDTALRERALLVKKLGFDGIELGQEWLNQSVESIQEQLSGIELAVSAIVHSIKLIEPHPQVCEQAVELDRQRLQIAKRLGASAIIEVPVFGPTRFQDLSPIMTPR